MPSQSAAQKRKRASYPPDFEAWWARFPERGRVAKPQAAAKFARIVAEGIATAADLVAGAERYGNSRKVNEGFVCNSLTWLNQQRWTAQEEPAGAPRPPPQRPNAFMDAIRRHAQQTAAEAFDE